MIEQPHGRLQIALTQPVQFDDVVVVEGHGGRSEEITATCGVGRIWDKRWLAAPLPWVIEHPL